VNVKSTYGMRKCKWLLRSINKCKSTSITLSMTPTFINCDFKCSSSVPCCALHSIVRCLASPGPLVKNRRSRLKWQGAAFLIVNGLSPKLNLPFYLNNKNKDTVSAGKKNIHRILVYRCYIFYFVPVSIRNHIF